MMRGRTLLNILVHLSRFGLAALWLFAAGAKLFTFADFTANLSNLVEARWVWPAAVAVIAAELLAAALLLLPRAARLGALASAAMLVGFAAYALYYVYVRDFAAPHGGARLLAHDDTSASSDTATRCSPA